MIPPITANELAYFQLLALGYTFSAFTPDREGSEYSAGSFYLNDQKIIFRRAKATPVKDGYFVTIWKRDKQGETRPFDLSDEAHAFVIGIIDGDQAGQFIFTKEVLRQQQVVSDNFAGGKRGIRVYPPWTKTSNVQAGHTQEWQIKYFLDMSPSKSIDFTRARSLYSIDSPRS